MKPYIEKSNAEILGFMRLVPIQIKVQPSISGYGWYAFVESRGEEGAYHGWTIQQALEYLLERLYEEFLESGEPESNLKYSWV